ncbi:MAG TPA: riboflavin biosynthesis protein RibF [Bacteroidales bacterium]|nr:riboflavin biosynthesis protein RibF [Bacteroidales bacterium]
MVRLKGIKNIIFDFGGVLVDLNPQACLDAFAALGLPQVADYLTPYGHQGPFGKVENGDIDLHQFRNEIRETFKVDLTDRQIEDAWGAFLLHTPLNKIKMVHELAKTYRVFLLSNTNPIHIRKLKEFDEAGYPISECFEKLYLSYEVGMSKPGRAIFEHVLSDAGIVPEETLLVDDAPLNCRTAAELGIHTFQPKPFEDFTGELLQPKACVATMGFFDGVHLGHRFLIDETIRVAAQVGLPSMVISFWPHPRTVLQTNYCPQLLTDRFEKEEKLVKTGADYIRTLTFDKTLSEMPARQFMEEILQQELHVKTLVIGFDHRFGNNRTDDFESYRRWGKEIGMEVLQATPFTLGNSDQETISSSYIRRNLLAGKMAEANAALGYIYEVRGTVVGGHQIGRQLGFPTANIEPLDSFKLLPAFGVYAVWVHVKGKRFKGMLDIGRRPTLHKDSDVTIEVHILNFEGDLYQQVITVGFVERFRADVAFPDVEALVAQLVDDRKYVDKLLKL